MWMLAKASSHCYLQQWYDLSAVWTSDRVTKVSDEPVTYQQSAQQQYAPRIHLTPHSMRAQKTQQQTHHEWPELPPKSSIAIDLNIAKPTRRRHGASLKLSNTAQI